MSTSITEEHRALWTKLYNLAHDEIFDVASSDGPAHQLIADSEAKAVASAVAALTCTHHNDAERTACPVCLVSALTAERGKLRAELAELHDSFAGNVHTRCNELRDELAAEREKVRVLRAALENLCDEQNGAPLETRRDQWQLATDEARAAIVATEDAK